MPSQRFLSLRNAGNGVLERKIGNVVLHLFWGEGGGGARLRNPLRDRARGRIRQ